MANEAQSWIDAAFAFSSDPMDSNLCENYKNALEDYLDEGESFRACAEELGDLNGFNQGISDACNSLNALSYS